MKNFRLIHGDGGQTARMLAKRVEEANKVGARCHQCFDHSDIRVRFRSSLILSSLNDSLLAVKEHNAFDRGVGVHDCGNDGVRKWLEGNALLRCKICNLRPSQAYRKRTCSS